MSARRPPPTIHRLTRLLTWTRVWLEMVFRLLPKEGGLGVFVGWMAPLLVQRVREVRADVLSLIFVLATRRIQADLTKPWPRPRLAKLGQPLSKFGQTPTRPTGLIRRCIGTRLRRLTRGRSLRAEIDALRALLRNPEQEIARLVRRLKNGLKRRVKIALARVMTLASDASAHEPAPANSS